MGRAKAAWMEEMERGYSLPGGHICVECVNDEWLRQWVVESASINSCDFCGSEEETPIAASFDDFIERVMVGVRFCWNNPDSEGIMYVSAEGGYQASISDNSEVFCELELSDNEDVIEALVNAVEDNGWVARGHYIGDEGDWLRSGWDHFKDIIKHHSRFFFLRPEEGALHFGPEVEPHKILDAIASVVTDKMGEYSLVRTISESEYLFRVRLDASDKHESASALGSPPTEFASQSNRMSPAGVPMFYGAFEESTALAETFDAEVSEDAVVSIGKFQPVRELKVLDLANLPKLPSIYDENRNYLINALSFLYSFAHDISKPIRRDGREHVEYVPTQIVTEYFRRVYQIEEDRIDGIVYPSSRSEGKSAFVLFCVNEQCVDAGAAGGDEAMIQLVEVEHCSVSDHTKHQAKRGW